MNGSARRDGDRGQRSQRCVALLDAQTLHLDQLAVTEDGDAVAPAACRVTDVYPDQVHEVTIPVPA